MANFDYKGDLERSLKLHDKYLEISRKYLDDIVNKTMLLSTVALGFVGVVLNSVTFKDASHIIKYIFIFGTLSFIVCLIMGVVFKMQLNIFFNKAGGAYYRRHTAILNYIITSGITSGNVSIGDVIIDLSEPEYETKYFIHNTHLTFFCLGILSFSILLFYFSLR